MIPKLFGLLYELQEFEKEEEFEIELIKEPKDDDCYRVKAKPELIASLNSDKYSSFKEKSFHLDNYCFDSIPESKYFWAMLNQGNISKIWFTGMLTHG